MLISAEHELPTLAANGEAGTPPEVFTALWSELATEGWRRDGDFAVIRMPTHLDSKVEKPGQVITTDTGPTIEIAPNPALTVQEIESQLSGLRALVSSKLQDRGIGIMGSGVHLRLGATTDEYYRYRTARSAYDYAVGKRGWHHNSILNIASLQEVIDVPTHLAPKMLSLMHRLSGVMLFLCRNDPDYSDGDSPKALSIRPQAWRDHVPGGGPFRSDCRKVYLPQVETGTWGEYLRLLWDANPMFMLGTKTDGIVYIPEHPTFATFVSSPQKGGWEAKRVGTEESLRIEPSMAHVSQTDWTYMGFARLRLFWNEDTSLSELVAAYNGSEQGLEGFLQRNLRKVLLENRSSACPLPHEEMCSLAFIVGLLENFDTVSEFVHRFSYEFWLRLAAHAEYHPFDSSIEGVGIPNLIRELLGFSRIGLLRRSYGEEQYLEPFFQRVQDKISPSELMLKLKAKGGMDAVTERLLYRFD